MDAWTDKGNALDDLGKHSKAIQCYDKAIEINSKYEDVFYNKGIALARVGCDADAAAAFAKAKELEANDRQEASIKS